jgi:capsid portal protein
VEGLHTAFRAVS